MTCRNSIEAKRTNKNKLADMSCAPRCVCYVSVIVARFFQRIAFLARVRPRPEEGKQMIKVNVSDADHQNCCNESNAEQVETNPMTTEEWLAIRREAALQIDPETAEVEWCYAQTPDPYGITPDLTEDCRQVGREYFACAPGSDVWVWFGDLPTETRNALWGKHRHKLAFPAGLEELDSWEPVMSDALPIGEPTAEQKKARDSIDKHVRKGEWTIMCNSTLEGRQICLSLLKLAGYVTITDRPDDSADLHFVDHPAVDTWRRGRAK
jgi:hypothetical protein